MSEVDDLINDLKNDDKKVKQRAADRLGEIGDTVEVLRALQDVSGDRGTKNKAKKAAQKVQDRMDSKSSGGAWGSSTFSEDDD